MAKEQIELSKVILRLVIEAEFEIDSFDNGSEVDESIENALSELQGRGRANITKRTLIGVTK